VVGGVAWWIFGRPVALPGSGAAPAVVRSGSGHVPGRMVVAGPDASAPSAPAQAQAQPQTAPADDPVAQAIAGANRLADAGEFGAAVLALEQVRGAAASDRIDLHIAAATDRGRAWYRSQVAGLPAGGSAQDIAARLPVLAILRDRAIPADRADAESRWTTELARLSQRLSAARVQARRQIDDGQAAVLPALAAELAPAFAGTPVAGLHRQFASACREAAQGSGAGPDDILRRAGLALLRGDGAAARALLAGADGFDRGDLMKRREALLGRDAAVLAFDDAADLQAVDAVLGSIRLERGALTGAAEEMAVVGCVVAVGGPTWEAGITGSFSGASDEAIGAWTVQAGDNVAVSATWTDATVTVEVPGAARWTAARTAATRGGAGRQARGRGRWPAYRTDPGRRAAARAGAAHRRWRALAAR
jgi:hypothetical protein